MLELKKPSAAGRHVEGNYTFPPYVSWPSVMQSGKLAQSSSRSHKSTVRNLSILLFYFYGVSASDSAKFFEISESRVRTLTKETKVKLFGPFYQSSNSMRRAYLDMADSVSRNAKQSERKLLLENADECLNNKPEITSVLYCINLHLREVTDMRLFHHAVLFLTSLDKPFDLKSYEEAGA